MLIEIGNLREKEKKKLKALVKDLNKIFFLTLKFRFLFLISKVLFNKKSDTLRNYSVN